VDDKAKFAVDARSSASAPANKIEFFMIVSSHVFAEIARKP
jgi:hypothetical protein